MTTTWKEAGKVWKALTLRTISARRKMCNYEVNTTHKRRKKIPTFVTLLSAYAPHLLFE